MGERHLILNEEVDRLSWNRLCGAIKAGDIEFVKQSLRERPDFLHTDGNDTRGSLLHQAVNCRHVEIVKLLIEQGADINAFSDSPKYALTRAASNGDVSLAQLLIENGAHINTPGDGNPMLWAIGNGHYDFCKLLVERGFDIRAEYTPPSGRKKTALSHAVALGEEKIAEFLKSVGCVMPDQPPPPPDSPEVAREKRIVGRLIEAYGPADPVAMREIIPVHRHVSVAIHVIRPTATHPYLTLFTTGMSDRKMRVPEGQQEFRYAELVMHLPANWRLPKPPATGDESTMWPVQWLRKLAYLPHLNRTWLGGPHTIVSSDEPPAPLGPGIQESCLLLVADFADWSPIKLEDGSAVKFYTVIPIFAEERDFEKANGLVALLNRFEANGVTAIFDPNRKNAAG